jgi:hypothetical protein
MTSTHTLTSPERSRLRDARDGFAGYERGKH